MSAGSSTPEIKQALAGRPVAPGGVQTVVNVLVASGRWNKSIADALIEQGSDEFAELHTNGENEIAPKFRSAWTKAHGFDRSFKRSASSCD